MYMSEKFKVAIACGGTGGHIFPGLATAKEMRARGHEVTLWMSGKDIEHDALQGWEGEIVTIPSEGFQFGISMRSLLTIVRLNRAYRLALPEMRRTNPAVVLAMGSYASFGPVMAARRLKIPYVLHEANLVPGKAVSMLSRWANSVAISFEKSSYYLKHSHLEFVGMPLRKSLLEAGKEERTPYRANGVLRLLVMGGSRGASVLNEVVPKALVAAAEKGVQLEVDHIAGLQETDEIERVYKEGGLTARVYHFVQQVEAIYPKVDLAICRAGAATCAELSLFALPALLVPYPFAARNHQLSNARALQDSGAADVVAQEDLTASWLRDYIENIFEKPERLERMIAAMKKRAQPDAAGKLADLLEREARKA
jgi:UDP-N-acetylglucosamine--N-acetylmuramyl-(pentapeptide) pyrophosphoryl-undecaprenol N-acetylglucosamine transferase